MNQTLLHIATLPYNSSEIQHSASKVAQSIHDVRGMRASHRVRERTAKQWDENGEFRTIVHPGFESSFQVTVSHSRLQQNPREWSRNPQESFAEQETMCRFLVAALGASHIGLPDRHGNTMLHYLASTTVPHRVLIDWLKLQNAGASTWQTSTNSWGHTPQDLYEDSEAAREQLSKGDGKT